MDPAPVSSSAKRWKMSWGTERQHSDTWQGRWILLSSHDHQMAGAALAPGFLVVPPTL